MFSLRIVTTDHYTAPPSRGLDAFYSDFRGMEVRQVPIIRIFGSTPSGQKTCMHLHGVFPYLYVPYDGTMPWNQYLRQFASSLDKAMNVAMNNASSKQQHVYKISLVSGIPMYGYHEKEQQFLKIYLYNPQMIKKVADLLLGGTVMNKVFQPHESHIPYKLQMFIDYNLYGMNLINVAAVKFRRKEEDDVTTPSLDRHMSVGSDTSTGESPSSMQSWLNRSISINTPSQQRWDSDNIPSELYVSNKRQSTCELEVDIVAPDILNRLEVDANIGTNPGLAALWEDEKQRRRDLGESSQISAPDSQEREDVEVADSEVQLMERLREIILLQQPYIDSQPEESSQEGLTPDVSSTPASSIELHSSLEEDDVVSSPDTVIVEEEDDAAIVNLDSIQRVVSFSQSFSLQRPQSLDATQDRSLAQILASLARDDSPPPSQQAASQLSLLEEEGSIISGIPSLHDDETARQDEEETLDMSQRVWETGGEQENDPENAQFDVEGIDNTWTESQLIIDDVDPIPQYDGDPIPQYDGAVDEKPREDPKKRLGMHGAVFDFHHQTNATSGAGFAPQYNPPYQGNAHFSPDVPVRSPSYSAPYSDRYANYTRPWEGQQQGGTTAHNSQGYGTNYGPQWDTNWSNQQPCIDYGSNPQHCSYPQDSFSGQLHNFEQPGYQGTHTSTGNAPYPGSNYPAQSYLNRADPSQDRNTSGCSQNTFMPRQHPPSDYPGNERYPKPDISPGHQPYTSPVQGQFSPPPRHQVHMNYMGSENKHCSLLPRHDSSLPTGHHGDLSSGRRSDGAPSMADGGQRSASRCSTHSASSAGSSGPPLEPLTIGPMGRDPGIFRSAIGPPSVAGDQHIRYNPEMHGRLSPISPPAVDDSPSITPLVPTQIMPSSTQPRGSENSSYSMTNPSQHQASCQSSPIHSSLIHPSPNVHYTGSMNQSAQNLNTPRMHCETPGMINNYGKNEPMPPDAKRFDYPVHAATSDSQHSINELNTSWTSSGTFSQGFRCSSDQLAMRSDGAANLRTEPVAQSRHQRSSSLADLEQLVSCMPFNYDPSQVQYNMHPPLSTIDRSALEDLSDTRSRMPSFKSHSVSEFSDWNTSPPNSARQSFMSGNQQAVNFNFNCESFESEKHLPEHQADVMKTQNPKGLAKKGRPKGSVMTFSKSHSVPSMHMPTQSPAYTYTFHVPTPVYKRLKFMRKECSIMPDDVTLVRMHPMDARRYSLMKIGQEVVRVQRLTPVQISKLKKSLKAEGLSGTSCKSPVIQQGRTNSGPCAFPSMFNSGVSSCHLMGPRKGCASPLVIDPDQDEAEEIVLKDVHMTATGVMTPPISKSPVCGRSPTSHTQDSSFRLSMFDDEFSSEGKAEESELGFMNTSENTIFANVILSDGEQSENTSESLMSNMPTTSSSSRTSSRKESSDSICSMGAMEDRTCKTRKRKLSGAKLQVLRKRQSSSQSYKDFFLEDDEEFDDCSDENIPQNKSEAENVQYMIVGKFKGCKSMQVKLSKVPDLKLSENAMATENTSTDENSCNSPLIDDIKNETITGFRNKFTLQFQNVSRSNEILNNEEFSNDEFRDSPCNSSASDSSNIGERKSCNSISQLSAKPVKKKQLTPNQRLGVAFVSGKTRRKAKSTSKPSGTVKLMSSLSVLHQATLEKLTEPSQYNDTVEDFSNKYEDAMYHMSFISASDSDKEEVSPPVPLSPNQEKTTKGQGANGNSVSFPHFLNFMKHDSVGSSSSSIRSKRSSKDSMAESNLQEQPSSTDRLHSTPPIIRTEDMTKDGSSTGRYIIKDEIVRIGVSRKGTESNEARLSQFDETLSNQENTLISSLHSDDIGSCSNMNIFFPTAFVPSDNTLSRGREKNETPCDHNSKDQELIDYTHNELNVDNGEVAIEKEQALNTNTGIDHTTTGYNDLRSTEGPKTLGATATVEFMSEDGNKIASSILISKDSVDVKNIIEDYNAKVANPVDIMFDVDKSSNQAIGMTRRDSEDLFEDSFSQEMKSPFDDDRRDEDVKYSRALSSDGKHVEREDVKLHEVTEREDIVESNEMEPAAMSKDLTDVVHEIVDPIHNDVISGPKSCEERGSGAEPVPNKIMADYCENKYNLKFQVESNNHTIHESTVDMEEILDENNAASTGDSDLFRNIESDSESLVEGSDLPSADGYNEHSCLKEVVCSQSNSLRSPSEPVCPIIISEQIYPTSTICDDKANSFESNPSDSCSSDPILKDTDDPTKLIPDIVISEIRLDDSIGSCVDQYSCLKRENEKISKDADKATSKHCEQTVNTENISSELFDLSNFAQSNDPVDSTEVIEYESGDESTQPVERSDADTPTRCPNIDMSVAEPDSSHEEKGKKIASENFMSSLHQAINPVGNNEKEIEECPDTSINHPNSPDNMKTSSNDGHVNIVSSLESRNSNTPIVMENNAPQPPDQNQCPEADSTDAAIISTSSDLQGSTTEADTTPCSDTTDAHMKPCSDPTDAHTKPCSDPTDAHTKPCSDLTDAHTKPCSDLTDAHTKPCSDTTDTHMKPYSDMTDADTIFYSDENNGNEIAFKEIPTRRRKRHDSDDNCELDLKNILFGSSRLRKRRCSGHSDSSQSTAELPKHKEEQPKARKKRKRDVEGVDFVVVGKFKGYKSLRVLLVQHNFKSSSVNVNEFIFEQKALESRMRQKCECQDAWQNRSRRKQKSPSKRKPSYTSPERPDPCGQLSICVPNERATIHRASSLSPGSQSPKEQKQKRLYLETIISQIDKTKHKTDLTIEAGWCANMTSCNTSKPSAKKKQLTRNQRLGVAFLTKSRKKHKSAANVSVNINSLSLLHEATLENLSDASGEPLGLQCEDVLYKMALVSPPVSDESDKSPPQALSPDESYKIKSDSSTSSFTSSCPDENSQPFIFSQSMQESVYETPMPSVESEKPEVTRSPSHQRDSYASIKVVTRDDAAAMSSDSHHGGHESSSKDDGQTQSPSSVVVWPRSIGDLESEHIPPLIVKKDIVECHSLLSLSLEQASHGAKYNRDIACSNDSIITSDRHNEQTANSIGKAANDSNANVSSLSNPSNFEVDVKNNGNELCSSSVVSDNLSDDACRPPTADADRCSDETSIVLCPAQKAPSHEDIKQSARIYNLPTTVAKQAYCSNTDDLPDKARELGGRLIRLPSNLVRDLPVFESSLLSGGLESWRSVLGTGSQVFSTQSENQCLLDKITRQPELRFAMIGDLNTVITPCRVPPSGEAVEKWMKGRIMYKNAKLKHVPNHENADVNKNSVNVECLFVKNEKIKSVDNCDSPKQQKQQETKCCLSPLTINDLIVNSEKESTPHRKNEYSLSANISGTLTEDHGQSPQKMSHIGREYCDAGSGIISDVSLKPEDTTESAQPHPTSTPVKSCMGHVQEPTCTPITRRSRQKSTEENWDKFVTPKRSRPMRRPSGNNDSSLRRNLLDSQLKQFATPDQKACNSQIDGPTPKNPFGFKVSQLNVHDAKALHEVQHLTVMSMELHIETRGDLQPDPEVDPIQALFYSIHNDAGSDCPNREITGVLLVHEESTTDDSHPSSRPSSPKPSTSTHAPAPSPSVSSRKDKLLQKSGVTDLAITYVKKEEDLLTELVAVVRRWNPDIFVGYEIQMLSWGYVLQRAAQLSLDICSNLSRIPDAKQDNRFSAEKDEYGADHMSEINLVGRIVLNLWRLLRHEVTLNIYNFENVVYHVLHERIPMFSQRTLTSWYNHRTHLYRWRVIDYYLSRVKGNLQIMNKLDLIDKTSEFARVFGIEFYDVLSRGSQYRVESMMLRLAKPMNYIAASPGVQQRARMKAPECIALNLEPESRFYTDPVVVLDFQSLYPSIMIAYNYCFSTCLGRVESLANAHDGAFELGCTSLTVPPAVLKKLENDVTISPNGVVFVKRHIRKGIISSMVEEILNTRIMIKQAMKKHQTDKGLRKMLDARQLGLKLIANVTYGYTAANFSGRMPCVEVADSIVRKARETLERAIKLVEDTPRWGARVVYGDTDSMFLLLKGRSKEEAFKIGEEIRAAVTDMNPKPIKLRFEKVYLPCVLQTKKRYVGFSYETANQKEPVFDAKGIETIRRDNCPAVSKILERTIKLLFTTRDVSEVKQYVQRQCHKLLDGRVSLQDCIFAKEYRGMMGYKPSACVPALEIAKKLFRHDRRSEPRVGARVPYVIVYGSPGLPLIKLVRQPVELIRDPSLRLNSVYYITKQILPPLSRMFTLIGVDVFSWYQEMPKVVKVVPQVHSGGDSKKGTISQYFASLNCLVCGEQATQSLCANCCKNPQKSVLHLNEQIHASERIQHQLSQICSSCTGFNDYDPSCASLDCPIFFRANKASRDLKQADNSRQALETIFDF